MSTFSCTRQTRLRIATAAPVAYISTPNRLTLAPDGAEKSDNPWHLREYTLEEYRALLEPVFSTVEIHGLFHARKLRAHELAIRAGWDRLHEARHTFASLMIAAGLNTKALSVYMGHASVVITLDRYGHLMPGNEAYAATLLDAYLNAAGTASALPA